MKRIRGLNSQRGAVLVVCMIVLLMLTLIGLSGARGVILQEKMTFASKDAQLALQVAEAALRAAEAEIDGLTGPDAGFGSGHLFASGGAPVDLLDPDNWDDAFELDPALTMGDDNFTGHYFIEQAGQLAPAAGAGAVGDGYGPVSSAPPPRVFRIVARGRGLAGTERIIVTHYGRKF
jgi:type IV pilus assembly protein PilX